MSRDSLPAVVWRSLRLAVAQRRQRAEREAEREAAQFRRMRLEHPRDEELAARFRRMRPVGRVL